jgi:altronate dehydratase
MKQKTGGYINQHFFLKITNVPAAPAYGVYISKLIRYSMIFSHYSEVLDRVHLVTQSLLKQGYVARIDNISNTAGVLQEIGTAYYSLVST